MSRDHDRLDAILADFQHAKDTEKKRSLFQQFAVGLREHIGWEEGILFPPFEEKTSMRDAGPTAVMRMEHEHIRRLLRTVMAAVESSDETVQSLISVLIPHNHKEERVLYPWLDQSLTREEIAEHMKRIEGERSL